MQLECYEILTNKNDVEKRNGMIYKVRYIRCQLIGCNRREKTKKKGKASPPNHFRISYLSSSLFEVARGFIN